MIPCIRRQLDQDLVSLRVRGQIHGFQVDRIIAHEELGHNILTSINFASTTDEGGDVLNIECFQLRFVLEYLLDWSAKR